MRIITKNFAKGFVKLQITNPDDLWVLSQLISKGDILSGKTLRKIKIGDSIDGKASVIKKPAFIKIQVEKVEYSTDSLRALGPIIEGPDDVPKGSYHSFTLEQDSQISLEKDKWYSYQIKKLQESESAQPKILICVTDREEAYFALSQMSGYKLLSKLQGDVEKKELRASSKNTFYIDVIAQLKEYSERFNADRILLASPAFWKEDIMKLISDTEFKKKIILVTCSSVSENALNEILKRPETRHALQLDRAAKEMTLVEELLREIAIDGKAAYGLNETKSAAQVGAVEHLMITDGFIQKTREEDTFDVVDRIMKTVDSSQGEVTVISSEHDGGKKLDGLGGIGALLRYKMNY